MRGAAWLLFVLLGVAGAFACLLHLEGAPCNDDDNCPKAQYCGYDGGCVTRPIPLDLACQKILRTLAKRVAECRGGDPAAYELFVGERLVCDSLLSSADAGRLAYDPGAVDDCRSALASESCDAVLQLNDVRTLLAGCQVLTPRQGEGQGCGSSFDCVTSAYCDTSSTCPGVCRPLIPPGAACDPAGTGCEPNAVCFGGTCRAYLAADAGCNIFTPPCGAGLGCVSGTCVPGLTTDGGCTALIGTECAARYSCAGAPFAAHTCQPAKDVGDPCTPGYGECGLLLWCGGSPAACRPWAHRLERCGLIGGELVGCLDGRCLNNTCEAFLDGGEKCSSDSECGPAGRCAPAGDGGSACRATFCN